MGQDGDLWLRSWFDSPLYYTILFLCYFFYLLVFSPAFPFSFLAVFMSLSLPCPSSCLFIFMLDLVRWHPTEHGRVWDKTVTSDFGIGRSGRTSDSCSYMLLDSTAKDCIMRYDMADRSTVSAKIAVTVLLAGCVLFWLGSGLICTS